jgi:hypothetical protein
VTDTPIDPPPAVVDKLMTLTPAEFALSAGRLTGAPVAEGAAVDLPAPDGGRVTITCTPLAEVRLGGLLALPRARVTVRFDGVAPVDRTAFLRRFDLAFQRGGG